MIKNTWSYRGNALAAWLVWPATGEALAAGFSEPQARLDSMDTVMKQTLILLDVVSMDDPPSGDLWIAVCAASLRPLSARRRPAQLLPWSRHDESLRYSKVRRAFRRAVRRRPSLGHSNALVPQGGLPLVETKTQRFFVEAWPTVEVASVYPFWLPHPNRPTRDMQDMSRNFTVSSSAQWARP